MRELRRGGDADARHRGVALLVLRQERRAPGDEQELVRAVPDEEQVRTQLLGERVQGAAAAARGASGGGGRRRRAAAFPTGVHEPAAARARRRRLDVERDQRGGALRFRGGGFGGGGGSGGGGKTALRVSVVRSVVPGKFRVLRRVPRGLERRPGDGESVRPVPGGARGFVRVVPGDVPGDGGRRVGPSERRFRSRVDGDDGVGVILRLEVREVVGRGRGPRRPRGGVGRRGRGHGGRRPAVRGVPCVAGEPRRDSRRERGGCRVGRGRGRRGGIRASHGVEVSEIGVPDVTEGGACVPAARQSRAGGEQGDGLRRWGGAAGQSAWWRFSLVTARSRDVVFDSRVVRGPARTVTPAPMVRHDALLVRQLVSASSSGARRRAVSASGADILGARTDVTFCEVLQSEVEIFGRHTGARESEETCRLDRVSPRLVDIITPRSARWALRSWRRAARSSRRAPWSPSTRSS